MTLTCEKAREILWPLEGPREAHPGEDQARQHLAACEACRGFFERDAMLGRALRERSTTAISPPELQRRVRKALDREPWTATRPGGRWRVRGWRLVAAAAVLALAVGALWLRPSGGASLTGAEAYATDYLRVAAADPAPPSGLDTAAVAGFYQGELGYRIVPVSLDEARLTRALICVLEGKRGAMVEYRMDGTRLAHYRIPLDRPAKGGDILVTSEGEVRVVRWQDERYEHALVSEMPEGDLERLAVGRFASR